MRSTVKTPFPQADVCVMAGIMMHTFFVVLSVHSNKVKSLLIFTGKSFRIRAFDVYLGAKQILNRKMFLVILYIFQQKMFFYYNFAYLISAYISAKNGMRRNQVNYGV